MDEVAKSEGLAADQVAEVEANAALDRLLRSLGLLGPICATPSNAETVTIRVTACATTTW